MADEAVLPPLDPRMVELIREAIGRGVPRMGYDEPIDKPPILTGRDAALVREFSRQVVDERLRERQLLSETEIKAVAREIAQAIAEKTVSGVKEDLRTEEQIKAIAESVVIDKLREVGIRADEAHVDETREALAGMQRSHRRRSELGTDFVREVLKALAGWAAVGIASAGITYIAIKGGPR